MRTLNSRLLKVFDLFNYFVYHKNDFLVSSIDIYIYLKFGFDDLFKYGFFKKNNPSLKIFFSDKNLKFSVDKELYGIPIFPPVYSAYYKLYEKIIDIYGSVKIDICIIDEESYQIMKKDINIFGDILLLNMNFYPENIIKQLEFKINSIEKTSYFAFKDIYKIILQTQLLNKSFNKNQETYKNEIIKIYKNLNLMFGKSFKFESGNLNKSTYIGIARVLIEDDLSISNDVINTFNKGDIIIAENTSVSYMKYIIISGGIVTVNNNKLSHASIISRELNLPLVLGAENLFLKIFDGDLIEINSSNGEVKVLKRFYE